MNGAIQVEAGGKLVGYPCQGGDRRCHVAIHPNRGANGATWQLLSGEGQPVTISPSIDCKTCGFHGHIRDGQIETITPGDPEKVERQLWGDED